MRKKTDGQEPIPNKQKTALIAALCAFVMIVTLVLSFVLSSNLFQNDEPAIVLPSQISSDDTELGETVDFAEENARKITQIEIRPDNVQQVIASLSRPDSYSCVVSNTLYWDGGNSTLQCKQYVRQTASRVELLRASGEVDSVVLQYDGHIYAWDAGSSTYYSGQAGSFTPAETAMLPTYETVCALPKEQIQQAELLDVSGQPMIRVVAWQDGRTVEYTISTVTGLLHSAVFTEEGVQTQSIQISVLSLTQQKDNLFTLPEMEDTVFEMEES